MVDGVLQVMTPTPLGDRLETFPTNGTEQTDEIDGQTWLKSHRWVGNRLCSTARHPAGAKPNFETERYIDEDGTLVQLNTHDGVAFTRWFNRKDPS